MTRHTTFAWALVAASLLFAVMPYFTPFNGFNPDAFPIPQNDPPAQPAGYAFAIWGVIYLWLLVSTIYGALRRAEDPQWQAARPALLVSLVIGAAWLPVAGVSPPWATVLIWAMLATALVALRQTPLEDRWLFRAPVALYAGWLAAASWVSVALLGAGYGFFMGEMGWALVTVAGATALALAVLYGLPWVPELGLAVTWALVAVAVQNVEAAPRIATLAGLAAFVVLIATIVVTRASILALRREE